jgi:hypothetical protein
MQYLRITATDIVGKKIEANYDTVPDTCPICHQGISVIKTNQAFVSAVIDDTDWTGFLEILYRCPRHDCGRSFLAIYRQHVQNTGNRDWFFFQSLAPTEFKPPQIDKQIRAVSPNFVRIYGQALEAERLGLDQICGGGLRRAVEFLVKDYLIQTQAEKAEAIKKTFLGTCIENYINDPNVKACASRATWLGNDETHYERKYGEHDIQNLKELIELTMYWIKSEMLTAKYNTELKKKS